MVLSKKLYWCGIKAQALKLVASYLGNRQQSVSVNDTCSESNPVLSGIFFSSKSTYVSYYKLSNQRCSPSTVQAATDTPSTFCPHTGMPHFYEDQQPSEKWWDPRLRHKRDIHPQLVLLKRGQTSTRYWTPHLYNHFPQEATTLNGTTFKRRIKKQNLYCTYIFCRWLFFFTI